MTPATVVLVHGSCSSPAIWARVVPALDDRDIANSAVQLPSCLPDSEFDDAGAVRSVLDDCDGPLVLVSHSYGGMTLTEAGDHPSVEHLVYLDSVMADVGESVFALSADNFDEDFVACSHIDGDIMQFDTEASTAYFVRCGWSERDAHELVAGSRPQRLSAMLMEPSTAAWKTVPTTFVSCQDSEMSRELRALCESRANAVVELPGDHFPMWRRPDEVADILVRIASEVAVA